MKKNIVKKSFILTIFISLIGIPFSSIISNDSVQSIEVSNGFYLLSQPLTPLITFPSYIASSINTSDLDLLIRPESGVGIIDITIEYWADIPKIFQIIPHMLTRIFLFNTFILYPHKIYLDTVNVSEGISAIFAVPEIYTLVNLNGEKDKNDVTMFISASKNVPSTQHEFSMLAYCENIGRIMECEHQRTIEFFVDFFPNLQIDAQQFTECPRYQTTEIPINVKNCGNWISQVNSSIVEEPDEFLLELNPTSIDIEMDETEQFFLEVTPLDYVGDKIIPLKFTSIRQPDLSGISGNFTYYLIVSIV